MKKIISLTLFVLLSTGLTSVFAADTNNAVNSKEARKTQIIEDYNFDENSFNISDEQLNEAAKAEENLIDEKVDFRTQIINSSHFTSNSPYKNARGTRGL